MKKIPLTQGKYALIDDSDFEWLSQYKWRASGGGKRKYYAVRTWYAPGGKGKIHRVIRLHHLVYFKGSLPPGFEIDHINGDGLDNRRHNLRKCKPAENKCNRRPQRKMKGDYKGVTWRTDINKWRAMIRSNGKLIHLGYFENEINAAKRYNQAAITYHGEFARLNDIPTII